MREEPIFGKAQEKTSQTASAQAIAQQQSAAAGIFAAHAGIPYVGPIIAAGLVAMMTAVLAANAASATALNTVKARAVGGLVTSPEITLLGEAGPELVAPEADFKDWARGLVLMGANLQSNIQMNQDRVLEYHLQAASFAQAAQRQGDRNVLEGRSFAGVGGSNHYHLHGNVFTRDSREMGEFFNEGRKAWESANG